MDFSGVLPHFQGVAVHDFWMSYYKYEKMTHAACNAHLLREMIGVVENDSRQTWAEDMMRLLLHMKAVIERFICEGKAEMTDYRLYEFCFKYDAIVENARNQNPIKDKPFGKRGRQSKGKVRALVERFAFYKAEVCLFIKNFSVPFENNQAERDVRMFKVKQKVSGCFRTKEGADSFATIMSYVGTANKHSINAFTAIKDALAGRSEILIFNGATE